MRLLWVALLAACATTAQLSRDHPARSTAPTGRLAGAPASLRPGVANYPDLPARREPPPPTHHHHTP